MGDVWGFYNVSTSWELWKLGRAILLMLQVDDAVNSDSWDEIHVEYGVGDPGDAQEKQRGAAEQDDV